MNKTSKSTIICKLCVEVAAHFIVNFWVTGIECFKFILYPYITASYAVYHFISENTRWSMNNIIGTE